MLIKLDLRTGLSKVTPERVALPRKNCFYTAPCAIGAMITLDQRNHLYCLELNNTSIYELKLRSIADFPEEQEKDLIALQASFDSGDSELFWATVEHLKEKYL